MSLTYQLGISSVDAITLDPEAGGFREAIKPVRSETRTKGGNRYSYQFSTWQTWSFPLEFVPNATRDIVTSWWQTQAELLLFITSDTSTAVHSVQIVNDDSPLQSVNKPYIDQWRGTLEVTTY